MPMQIEDLTWQFIDEGLLVRRQLSKRVVDIRSSWLTVTYLYQDLNRKDGTFDMPKVALVRYRKRNGGYEKVTQFNLSLFQTEEALPHLAKFLRDAPQMVAELDGERGPLDPPSLGRPRPAAPE